MPKSINVGAQSFSKLIETNCLFVDKTSFIKEWWENEDDITLITRPRRFGKTLTMDMVNCFFSNQFKNRGDLFEDLAIYKESKFREIQGTYPVIYISFADVKKNKYLESKRDIIAIIRELYRKYKFIPAIKEELETLNDSITDSKLSRSIQYLSTCLAEYYNKKVIILLDEYDTPMQEAYIYGYWEELSALIRSLFNSTFKTNQSLYRAIMTGITRVSKESIFSDLNNLEVITTTSNKYSTSFGFTEREVFSLLEEYGLEKQEEEVKKWYDGFTFGKTRDIYNPWSIINLLDKKKFEPYWTNTSDNGLISKLCKECDADYKKDLELLVQGKTIHVTFDEQIIFDQLNTVAGSLWALMVASGYLKIENVNKNDGISSYQVSLTNYEVRLAMNTMIERWFNSIKEYNLFVKYLLDDDLDGMNEYMNYLTLDMISSFDVADSKRISPENFYHGFVLGLVTNLRYRYEITSNRESGTGRYDIMLRPIDDTRSGFIFEFKVFRPKDQTMENCAMNAIKQINEKKYEYELIKHGITDIRKYGFAFKGKEVLIVKGE